MKTKAATTKAATTKASVNNASVNNENDFLKSLNLKKVTDKVTYSERAQFISKFIEQNKYTQKQLSAILNSVFVAHTKAANNTLLVDSKNVLYYTAYRLKNIVLVDKKTNTMSFATYSDAKLKSMRESAQSDKIARKQLKNNVIAS